MTNRPDVFVELRDQISETKVTFTPDAGFSHAATIRLAKEDYTLGNLLRNALLRNPNVVFAAYRLPHPLEHNILINVRTNEFEEPENAFLGALDAVLRDIEKLQTDWKNEFDRVERVQDVQMRHR
jgi:DNA-directed RNA polymerase II subunit RPB11